jgi:hypothetical protein
MIRILTFCFIVCCLPSLAQQQEPQFKFYLAFEDANQERDTVWYGIDINATTGLKDTIFGERKVPLDTGKFQVYFSVTRDSIFANKTVVAPRFGDMDHTSYITSINALDPVIVSWDTNLILNHSLPFDLKQAYIESQEISDLGFPLGYDLIGQAPRLYGDSIILYEVPEEEHRIFILTLSEKESSVGLEDILLNSTVNVQIFPNPAQNVIQIQTERQMQRITIFGSNGQLVESYENQNTTHTTLDVSSLVPGVYTFQLTTPQSTHYARFSKH